MTWIGTEGVATLTAACEVDAMGWTVVSTVASIENAAILATTMGVTTDATSQCVAAASTAMTGMRPTLWTGLVDLDEFQIVHL